MRKVDTFVLGPIQANCYLLWNDQHVLIVDPGSHSKKVSECINEGNGIVDGVVLTHGHIDHIQGADAFAKDYHCDIYISEHDFPMLYDADLNCSSMFVGAFTCKQKAKNLLPGKQTIHSFDLTIYDAPGHSEGSIMFVWDSYLFSGDVLFNMGIGRTDLPGGSNSKMMQTLQLIKTLDPSLQVMCGHGPSTTIQNELLNNPYL